MVLNYDLFFTMKVYETKSENKKNNDILEFHQRFISAQKFKFSMILNEILVYWTQYFKLSNTKLEISHMLMVYFIPQSPKTNNEV